MRVDFFQRGTLRPVSVSDVSQVVVRHANGTILMVASIHGDDSTVVVTKAGDPDYQLVLSQLGIKENVVTQEVRLTR